MNKLIALVLAAGLVTTGCTTKEEKTEPQQEQKQTETTNQTELTQEQEDSLWTLTSPFEVNATDSAGKTSKQTLIGEQGRFGFVSAPFEAGKKAKYTWKFWDKKASLPSKKLTIKAKHKDDVEATEVVSAAPIAPGVEGSDASLVSEFALPKKGKYRLDLFVDGKPYGGVIVEVK